jgi:hypothetical protein
MVVWRIAEQLLEGTRSYEVITDAGGVVFAEQLQEGEKFWEVAELTRIDLSHNSIQVEGHTPHLCCSSSYPHHHHRRRQSSPPLIQRMGK